MDVLGYLPTYRFGEIEKIDFSLVTHVDIAFANPDKNGFIKPSGSKISEVVQDLKKKEIIVYISLGGAGVVGQLADNWKKYMTSSKRSKLIKHIKDYCLANDFDGVDMDLEWDNVTNLYSPFVLELKDTLDKYSLGLTAALPGTYRYAAVSDDALKAFDVINIMAYDFRGPWTPNNPGQHSSYNDAVKSVSYWKNQGLPANKLRLGVPFYGYDFTNQSNITSFTFRDIVLENPDNAYVDKVGDKYYNGINTIKKKTELVKSEKLKGIMIWELGQDAFSPVEEYSLLKAINEIRTTKTNNAFVNNDCVIFPNPFENKLKIKTAESCNYTKLRLTITNVGGVTVYDEMVGFDDIYPGEIKSGVYFYTLISHNKVYRGKIIKL